MKTRMVVPWVMGIVLILFLVWMLVLNLALGPTNEREFHSLQAQLDGIVSKVKDLGMKQGEEKIMRVDKSFDPASLKEVVDGTDSSAGFGAGLVWARCDKAGKYTICVEVQDNGHEGQYGYAFSDGPFVLKDDPYDSIDVPGRLHQVGKKINDHWRMVENNLD